MKGSRMDKPVMSFRGESVTKETGEVEVIDKVKLDSLPIFNDLKKQVDEVVARSSWWDLYGVDCFIAGLALALFPLGIVLVGSESLLYQALGIFILGSCHSTMANKAGHISAHGGMLPDQKWSRPISVFFIEFFGNFSEKLAYEIHIKEHHPYTNIIGIGDSSSWKVPFLQRYTYMFFAPLLLPVVTIAVSIAGLVEKQSIFGLLKYIVISGAGLALSVVMLMKISNFSLLGALICVWIYRAIYAIPYIHVNIFQHIGLPMYSKSSRPVRLYQMSTGVLNLPRNILLDYAFGHSLINCHVEHHLFPRLSDNMCLKVKPVVSKFLKENGLPYNEDTYMSRLRFFIDKYEELMVNAPPITHFVGIQ